MFANLLSEGGGVLPSFWFDHLDFLGGGESVLPAIFLKSSPGRTGRIETVGRYLEHASHGEQATARENLRIEEETLRRS